MVSISHLLNPLPSTPPPSFRNHGPSHSQPDEAEPEINALLKLTALCQSGSVSAPSAVRNAVALAAWWFETNSPHRDITAPDRQTSPLTPSRRTYNQVRPAFSVPTLTDIYSPEPCETAYNVKLNRKTTLERLYTWPEGTFVEYLETSASAGSAVGHIFEMDVSSWYDPLSCTPYSLGSPRGASIRGCPVYISLLVDKDGEKVPCREFHATCQGSKVCPRSSFAEQTAPHTRATRREVAERLAHDRSIGLDTASARRTVFERTAALISALKKHGCSAPPADTGVDLELSDEELQEQARLRRGYTPHSSSCHGDLLLSFNSCGEPFIQ